MARILVIDDDADVRAVILDTLESAGHEVILAGDGNQGLRLQRLHQAELVITDILMPEKEGIETIRELRHEFPKQKIIAMSGGGRALASLDYLKVARELGAHVVLHKPFGSDKVLDAVRVVLGTASDAADEAA